MDSEEILKEHILRKRSVEDNNLIAAANLIISNEAKELADASSLLARTTERSAERLNKSNAISAELLAKTTQESAELLAKTTEKSAEQRNKSNAISAELLAKTTQESAELLAKTTQESAEQLSKSNAISVKSMERLTVAVIVVGVIQIAIAIVTLFYS